MFLDPKTLPSVSDVKITWGINSSAKTGNLTYSANNDERYVNIYKVSTALVYNSSINVQIEAAGMQYKQNVHVKIDKEAPNLNVDMSVNYETASKRIIFNGSDGAGSGVFEYGYALMDNASDTPVFNIKFSDNFKDVFINETYYAYAKDNVGNISKAVEINVTDIDNNKPVCKEPIDNPVWSRSYKYTYGCYSDIGTGCNSPDVTETETEEKQYKRVEWSIKDNVGNTEVCSKDVAVNVDTTPPTCEIKVVSGGSNVNKHCTTELVKTGEKCFGFFGFKTCHDVFENVETCYEEPNDWYNTDVKLKLVTNDNLSGVSEYGITTSSSPVYNGSRDATVKDDTDSNGITYYGYVKDKAGNTNSCSINIKKDSTSPTCEWTGENSTWTRNDQHITSTCKDSGSGCNADTISKTWDYSSGTTKIANLSYKVRDNAGNTANCTRNANVYIDKEGPDLNVLNAGSFLNWNKVEVTCDGYNCKILYKKNDFSQWVGGLIQTVSKASPFIINIDWSFKDSGVGLEKYNVVINPGWFESKKICYPGSDCNFLVLYLDKITIEAVDKLGNKSKTMNADVRCMRYLGVAPTYELLCY